jgi:hypothetical protein
MGHSKAAMARQWGQIDCGSGIGVEPESRAYSRDDQFQPEPLTREEFAALK